MVRITKNVKVRLLEVSYPRGVDTFPIFHRAISSGAFYQGLVGGPESALIKGGSVDRTVNSFLIDEDYAETMLAEFAALE
jgi:hypothetical protein